VSAPKSKVYVADCALGKGVFAATSIHHGEVIFTCEGKVISLQEVVAKGDQQSNPIQIDTQTYLDVESPGVYINHSCDPNAGLMNNTILVALRAIAPHEQICFDYSTSMSEELWTMECKCLAPQCRGLIQDFHYLPAELKARYVALGIVQDFIVRQWREVPKASGQ